jgi:predicted RNase H-like HicB family nuclease
MKEAIEFHLGGLKEDRMPIPEPTISAKCIEIAV